MGREVTGAPGAAIQNSAAPGRPGDPTPSDKTSALRDGRGVPEEVRTPRDRWPQGVPPAGTASTSENGTMFQCLWSLY